MPSKRNRWRPAPHEVHKICPKCGNKIVTTIFDNGFEMFCSKYNICDWEKWIQNPTHSLIGPEKRCTTVEIGRKKLISLGRN